MHVVSNSYRVSFDQRGVVFDFMFWFSFQNMKSPESEHQVMLWLQEKDFSSAKWRILGMYLGLRTGLLDEIHADHPLSSRERLLRVVNLWLKHGYDVDKHGPPSWNSLRAAVDKTNNWSERWAS